MERIEQLNGVTYKWRKEYKEDPKTYIGLIAQDVQKIVPEVVFSVDSDSKLTKDKKMLTVSYEQLVPLLIEGIKELHSKVKAFVGELIALSVRVEVHDYRFEEQDTKIEALETRLLKLENALSQKGE